MAASDNIVWFAVGLIGLALLTPSLGPEAAAPPPDAPKRPFAAPSRSAPAPAGNGLARREIARSPDGHFYLDAQVNGAQVRFLVDTGASVVALTAADAQRAGIVLPSERATAQGAGGDVEVMPVTIERIAAGPLAARDVPAAIAPELAVSLLGQSFLERVGSVEISGDTMVLR
ncbi:MAG TPA: TIGR02281 family clan AA aspartic protease [Allosphingosinicella sp.]|nr:TIGR02281 family clan AA aspartic protease [Allosphingosinicella sp.]